jgi:hypothetical protein
MGIHRGTVGQVDGAPSKLIVKPDWTHATEGPINSYKRQLLYIYESK